jgi:hypothetical protein
MGRRYVGEERDREGGGRDRGGGRRGERGGGKRERKGGGGRRERAIMTKCTRCNTLGTHIKTSETSPQQIKIP